jgi:ankyrin repeat protein
MTTSVSKVRSLTLDRLDARLLALIDAVGNERANALLEAERPPDARIAPDADQAARDAYIRRKYERCEWVRDCPAADLPAAIASADAPRVLAGIAQARKCGKPLAQLWHAAAQGDPTVALLIGLNTESLNALDSGGWSALSYAAYHGRLAAAEALISIGCDPNASPAAHPYAIALSRYEQNVTWLFQPYWSGGTVTTKEFTPPTTYEKREESNHLCNQSRFQTLHTITIAQREKNSG